MISLKITNITYRTTGDDLREIFGKYGQVGDVYVPKNRFNGENRGFAFVRLVLSFSIYPFVVVFDRLFQ